MSSRLALTASCVGAALVAVVLVLASPLRQVSGDVVPNRTGAVALRCAGTLDLSSVDWIRTLDEAGRTPYWLQKHDGAMYSVFGATPALVGALAMPGISEGDTIDDATMRTRERLAAALLLAIATGLVVLAAAARASLVTSFAAGVLCAASFAGAATLGQGLWQATVALPLLVGALVCLAWCERWVAARVLCPAILVAAVFVRPAIVPLAFGLGIAWCTLDHTRRQWLIASVLVVLAVAPFVAWQLAVFGSPLPLGQLDANSRVSDDVFVFSRAQVGFGIGGLLASPARGLIWFAPIVVLVAVRALRIGDRFARLVVGGMLFQLVVFGLFHMWWGGICYGPRFLAEAVWVGLWLATRVELGSRWLTGLTVTITLAVGQLGLWGWRVEQWETRRNPDFDQSALWDFTDSPIVSVLTEDADAQLTALDAVGAPRALVCQGGRLRDVQ